MAPPLLKLSLSHLWSDPPMKGCWFSSQQRFCFNPVPLNATAANLFQAGKSLTVFRLSFFSFSGGIFDQQTKNSRFYRWVPGSDETSLVSLESSFSEKGINSFTSSMCQTVLFCIRKLWIFRLSGLITANASRSQKFRLYYHRKRY